MISKNLRKLNFRQRQFLILVGLALVPLLIILGVVFPTSLNGLLGKSAEQLNTIGGLREIQIHNWHAQGFDVARLVTSRGRVITSLTSLLDQQDTAESQQIREHLGIELNTISSVFSSINAVSLLHPRDGQVIVSTDTTQLGRERKDQPYFIAGQQELTSSPITYSVGREAPIVNISAPVVDKFGERLLAVVVVEMDLDDLQNLMNNRTGLEGIDRTYLVESYGFYVTVPDDFPGSPLRTIAKSEGVTLAISGLFGSGIYQDVRGVWVLGAYRWIDELNSGLLVEQDLSLILIDILRNGIPLILLSLLLPILAVIAARLFVNWLVVPIERISQTAHALQEGHLDQRAPTEGPEEISRMAQTFNEMAAELQYNYESLEEIVSQRTQELETTNAQLRHEIEGRKKLQLTLEELATTDQLTELFNRHHFFKLAQNELERAHRHDRQLSVMMFDLDHFKIINDTYGHIIGDEILKGAAIITQKHIRSLDILARFGGEEFIILLPETDLETAQIAAERIRAAINKEPISTAKGNINITVSLGLSSLNQRMDLKLNDLIDEADQALYHAKKTGRNRTILFNPEELFHD